MTSTVLFASVLALTFASGAAATLVALSSRKDRSILVAERLAQIAILGAGAIIALLGSGGGG